MGCDVIKRVYDLFTEGFDIPGVIATAYASIDDLRKITVMKQSLF